MPPELAAAYEGEKHSGSSVSVKKTRASDRMSVSELERAMWDAVDKLDFERAAILRDAIAEREQAMKRKRETE